mmetsp:Transcript_126567/g.253038  ORF Transcript_126567/g.253038 Transcript_126567/m.253038 type:complete len:325 (+) Transcript_126567:100-1074(+)
MLSWARTFNSTTAALCASAAAFWRRGRRSLVETSKLAPLQTQDLEGVVSHLQNCKHVIVMVGAGASVSAGIPDFRTPGTGLYDNLQKYDLPYPEAVFDLRFFKKNPRPFYALCRELWPGQHQPTVTHYFIALLHQKGILQRCFTQNIDSLESLAGLPKEMIVAAHGNFDGATCHGTGRAVPPEEVKQAVMDGDAACTELNAKHGGLVKPDIVFFRENLPEKFFKLAVEDFPKCDLLLVIGTSLQVQPFAGLIRSVRPTVVRLLINRERVGEDDDGGFQFDGPSTRDVFLKCDCDDGIRQLVQLLGWEADLEAWMQHCAQATRGK